MEIKVQKASYDTITLTQVVPETYDDLLGQQAARYLHALEQIKLYHENMYGAKAKDFIAYDIACKALAGRE